MAKPVVRSNWKIDPAELALAQERTEARLANLFEHPVSGAPGHRPAIVVDGVPLIGSVEDAREPLPHPEPMPGMAGPETDVVGVADVPGAELLEVPYEQLAGGDLVGVMPREDDVIVPAPLHRGVAPRSAVAGERPGRPPSELAAGPSGAPDAPEEATPADLADPADPASPGALGLWEGGAGDAPTAAIAMTDGSPAEPLAGPSASPKGGPKGGARVATKPTPQDRRVGSAGSRGRAQPSARRAPAVVAAYCPYCAVLLDPPPGANRRCTRCRQLIVVKHIDGRVAYLTEAAVAIFEAERQKEAAAARLGPLRERWLRLATTAGAPASKVQRIADTRVSEEVVEAARTLYVGTVDRAFDAARRDHRWEDASDIRRSQALAMHRLAGSPMPPPEDVIALHREGVAAQLKGIAEISREAELVGSECCDACREADGQRSSISKELANPRLPHEGCPKGLCRCGWDLAARDREAILRYLRRRSRPARPAPAERA